MGLAVQRLVAVTLIARRNDAIHVGRNVVKALGTKKVPIFGSLEALDGFEGSPEFGVSRFRGEPRVPIPALGIEAHCDRNRFDQGRLASAVLSDEKSNGRMKCESGELCYG